MLVTYGQIKTEIFKYFTWTKDLRSGPPRVDQGAPTEKIAESAEPPLKLSKGRSFQFLLACEQFPGGGEGYSYAVAHPRRVFVGKLQTDQAVGAYSHNNKSIVQLKNCKQMPHLGDI